MNLLNELKERLEEVNKTIDDIKWVGTTDFKVDIETFLKLADTEYDDGYGQQEVAPDLLIVGDDWYIDRREYDGSEWFEFHKKIEEPTEILEIKALTLDQAFYVFKRI